MYTCPICTKSFETSRQYGGHFSSHYRPKKYKNTKSEVKRNLDHICKYCNQKFPTGLSLGGHIVLCKQRPDYAIRKEQFRNLTKSTAGKIKINKKCHHCGNFGVLYHGRYCISCKKEYYTLYLNSCQFTFNVFDYPDYFDLDLVKQYGWYTASNRGTNIHGINRDHMFSINDGYKNNIDSKIISHPANCKLMIHSINIQKHSKSSITLEELKNKIQEFNNKYGLMV